MENNNEATCHCGSEMNGSDHCPFCFCEQFESTCNASWSTSRTATSAWTWANHPMFVGMEGAA